MEGYEKLKTVGKGAFGTATLYRRLNDNRYVVMKEIDTMNLDTSEREAALNEVNILSSLNHPNIIRYLGSFQKDEALVIVMEYADGGNLAQLINKKRDKNETFSEKGILNILLQISDAISYMHELKILHRDLKTANIFLYLNGIMKVGDFGISKMLNTKSQAQTVVGTPYYLSPEMCEGNDYNEKSDVWAIGCILYELATLRKPFEAPTLPVLVKKIITCEYEDIPANFSTELSQLTRSILQINSGERPSAKQMHQIIIPQLLKKISAPVSIDYNATTAFQTSIPKERSILYEIQDFGNDQKVLPVELPHKKILHISASVTHQFAIMEDNLVYGWGENNYGQLALNQVDSFRKNPVFVKTLKDMKIIKSAAGIGFSIFLSSDGTVYSCGNGCGGVLGNGYYETVLEPSVIVSLSSKTVNVICGNHHVVALTNEGKVFTWGQSKWGELGQGHISKRPKPFGIIINSKIQQIFCSKDATILLTSTGQLLASGNNNCNKLGLHQLNHSNIFQIVGHTFGNVKEISFGESCTIILNDNGVLSILGNYMEHPEIVNLKNITLITSGPEFISVVDKLNVVWFWGTYKKFVNSPLMNSFSSDKTLTKFSSVVSLLHNQENNTVKKLGDTTINYTEECIEKPSSILALYACKEHIKLGKNIEISNILAKDNSLLIQIDTTVAPPVKKFYNHSSEIPGQGRTSRQTTRVS